MLGIGLASLAVLARGGPPVERRQWKGSPMAAGRHSAPLNGATGDEDGPSGAREATSGASGASVVGEPQGEGEGGQAAQAQCVGLSGGCGRAGASSPHRTPRAQGQDAEGGSSGGGKGVAPNGGHHKSSRPISRQQKRTSSSGGGSSSSSSSRRPVILITEPSSCGVEGPAASGAPLRGAGKQQEDYDERVGEELGSGSGSVATSIDTATARDRHEGEGGEQRRRQTEGEGETGSKAKAEAEVEAEAEEWEWEQEEEQFEEVDGISYRIVAAVTTNRRRRRRPPALSSQPSSLASQSAGPPSGFQTAAMAEAEAPLAEGQGRHAASGESKHPAGQMGARGSQADGAEMGQLDASQEGAAKEPRWRQSRAARRQSVAAVAGQTGEQMSTTGQWPALAQSGAHLKRNSSLRATKRRQSTAFGQHQHQLHQQQQQQANLQKQQQQPQNGGNIPRGKFSSMRRKSSAFVSNLLTTSGRLLEGASRSSHELGAGEENNNLRLPLRRMSIYEMTKSPPPETSIEMYLNERRRSSTVSAKFVQQQLEQQTTFETNYQQRQQYFKDLNEKLINQDRKLLNVVANRGPKIHRHSVDIAQLPLQLAQVKAAAAAAANKQAAADQALDEDEEDQAAAGRPQDESLASAGRPTNELSANSQAASINQRPLIEESPPELGAKQQQQQQQQQQQATWGAKTTALSSTTTMDRRPAQLASISEHSNVLNGEFTLQLFPLKQQKQECTSGAPFCIAPLASPLHYSLSL